MPGSAACGAVSEAGSDWASEPVSGLSCRSNGDSNEDLSWVSPVSVASVCSNNGRVSPSTACGLRANAGMRSPRCEACGPLLKKCSMDSRQVWPLAPIFGTTVPLPVPALRNSAACFGSPMVADSPMRRGLTPAMRDNRSIRHRVCPPRSPRINACSSSITMKRRSPNSAGMAACRCKNIASSDSGVICRIPEGCFMSLRLWDCETSPCQCHTGISPCAHTSLSRSNWSLIRALSGAIYNAPTDAGGSSAMRVRIG